MRSTEVVARPKRSGTRGAARQEAEGAVRLEARAVKEQAVEKVAEVSRRLRDEGERLLSQQKSRAADGLQGIGSSIHDAAGRLTAGPLEPVTPFVEAAAERVNRASEYLAEREVAELLEDAQAVLLRRPQWFLGGMFVTGLLLARFVKASAAAPEAPRRTARPRETRPARAPRRSQA